MTVNSLFCGAGGFDLGFINAGFKVVGAWDFDKYAVQSYKHNIGDHVEQKDIAEMTANDMQKSDVWIFGFPCQDLSIAGKQAGLFEGKRSGLFFEVMRLLDETVDKPKVIVAENVKGLKPYLDILKWQYESRGYKMYYTIYNSKFWGVPQNRERYFVVGVRENIEKEFVFKEQPTEIKHRLINILENEVDEKYYVDPEKTKVILDKFNDLSDSVHSVPLKFLDRNQRNLPNYAMCVDTSHTNGVAIKVKQATKKGYDEATTGDSINISHPGSKTRRGRVGKQVAQTLLTGQEQVIVEPKIITLGNTNPSGRGMNGNVFHTDGLSPTCTTNKGEGHKVYDGYKIRKLTPREYARLQGFPNTYEQVVSNSQFYKQMGNAVTVNVAEVVADAIKDLLSE